MCWVFVEGDLLTPPLFFPYVLYGPLFHSSPALFKRKKMLFICSIVNLPVFSREVLVYARAENLYSFRKPSNVTENLYSFRKPSTVMEYKQRKMDMRPLPLDLAVVSHFLFQTFSVNSFHHCPLFQIVLFSCIRLPNTFHPSGLMYIIFSILFVLAFSPNHQKNRRMNLLW